MSKEQKQQAFIDENDTPPGSARDSLLSNPEMVFYLVLKTMMGNFFSVCPKAALAAAIETDQPGVIDFLVVETQTMKPRLAVLLDEDNNGHDAGLGVLCEAAGLPLVRVPARPFYDTKDLGRLFRKALAVPVMKPKTAAVKPFIDFEG